jgi:hypothetical protein
MQTIVVKSFQIVDAPTENFANGAHRRDEVTRPDGTTLWFSRKIQCCRAAEYVGVDCTGGARHAGMGRNR